MPHGLPDELPRGPRENSLRRRRLSAAIQPWSGECDRRRTRPAGTRARSNSPESKRCSRRRSSCRRIAAPPPARDWTSEPVAIEALNSAASEFAPAFDSGGHLLFFGSERAGGCGGRDVWVSFRKNKYDDFAWEAPINLGCIVNSPGFDDGPTFFEDDEEGAGRLYFISNRPGGRGDRDLWMTTRSWDGTFSLPINVTELNSPASDSRPGIRRDGLEIFLTSQRTGSVPAPSGAPSSDVWTALRETTADSWSEPINVATLNGSGADAAPALSKDALTMYFNSDRAGGFGGLDLYVTTRTKTHNQ